MPAGCARELCTREPLSPKKGVYPGFLEGRREGTQEVQLSQINTATGWQWKVRGGCSVSSGSVTWSLKGNPRVSTNLSPWGGSGKRISISFLPCLLKGLLCHVRHCPVFPPLPLGRCCSREIRKASSWAAPLLLQDVSADSLKRDFSIISVGFLWKAPGTSATRMSWAPWLGNAFVNDCHSFQPCAALFDGLDMTPVLRCSGAADKVRCKEIHLWHEKSNSYAVCTWQIHGLSLFPRKPPKIQTEKQMHSNILRNELFTGDALPGGWWTELCRDVITILLFKCIFWILVSLCCFLPFSQVCGNTELQVIYWVNGGIPIGTLVVIGVTGIVHGRRRWEVRCMKEGEAKESQLRDQRKTRVTRKCLLCVNVPRTETWHAY